MIKTMIEQILGTITNKEVYPDYYIVGEQGENNLLVFKDAKGKIIGFTLIEPEQEKENDKGKKNISRNVPQLKKLLKTLLLHLKQWVI